VVATRRAVRKRFTASGLRQRPFGFANMENDSARFFGNGVFRETHVLPELFILQIDVPWTCEETCCDAD
jgi:hypothetical protein